MTEKGTAWTTLGTLGTGKTYLSHKTTMQMRIKRRRQIMMISLTFFPLL